MSDYKLVPVEPTPAMREPWRRMRGYSWYNKYKAMLAAAPAVQGEPVGWQLDSPGGRVFLEKEYPAWAGGGDGYRITPLYAAPQIPPVVQVEPVGEAGALRGASGFTAAVFESSKVPEGTKLYASPQPAEKQPEQDVADYEEALASHRRLTRELDVLLNGEEGAAEQASLCDLVAQLRTVVRKTGKPVLAAPDVAAHLVEALAAVLDAALAYQLNEADFAVAEARAALAAHRSQGGEV